MQQALFWEEMARVEAPPMANSLGLGLIGPTIIACGTEAQKKRYIRCRRERAPSLMSADSYFALRRVSGIASQTKARPTAATPARPVTAMVLPNLSLT